MPKRKRWRGLFKAEWGREPCFPLSPTRSKLNGSLSLEAAPKVRGFTSDRDIEDIAADDGVWISEIFVSGVRCALLILTHIPWDYHNGLRTYGLICYTRV